MAIEEVTVKAWQTSDGKTFQKEEEAEKHEVRIGIRRILETHGFSSMDRDDVADILSDHAAELKELLK